MGDRRQPVFRRNQRRWARLCAGFWWIILAGCSGAATGPDLAQSTEMVGAEQRFTADAAELEETLERVFDQLGWAVVSIRENERGLQARALVPDGREAAVSVHEPGDDADETDDPRQLRFHVRVGHFGSPVLERRFFEVLERELE